MSYQKKKVQNLFKKTPLSSKLSLMFKRFQRPLIPQFRKTAFLNTQKTIKHDISAHLIGAEAQKRRRKNFEAASQKQAKRSPKRKIIGFVPLTL